MFDLEQSIADWRQHMRSAGIQSSATLEELEAHLREEIERQTDSGLKEQAVFDLAVQKIGQAGLLKAEFKKAGSFSKWLSKNETAPALRVLGLLWLILSVSSLFVLSGAFFHGIQKTDIYLMSKPFPLFMLLMDLIYLLGAWAGILLFKGDLRERRFLRFLAGIFVIGGVAAITAGHASPLTLSFTIFGLISIWLLRPPQKRELANK